MFLLGLRHGPQLPAASESYVRYRRPYPAPMVHSTLPFVLLAVRRKAHSELRPAPDVSGERPCLV